MNESADLGIGERLRIFRESKKLTQAQMAAAVGGSTPGYKSNEQGTALPNSKLLIGLRGMGLNVDWLLSGEGPMLRADLHGSVQHELVSPERLGFAIAAVDKVAKDKGVSLSSEKRGKLAALVYQYFMLEKAEQEASTYLEQLMELISNN